MMNTGDSGTNKTTIFLEYMNEIYVDRDFYSRGKIIEMAKDKYVELHGNVNNNKEFNSLATKCGFENHTSMLKFMETYGIILTEVDPLLTNSKDDWVSKIKQRIESEYRKHPDLDWAEIAARKIYDELLGK